MATEEALDTTGGQSMQIFFYIMYFSLPENIPPRPLGGTRVRKHWIAIFLCQYYRSLTISEHLSVNADIIIRKLWRISPLPLESRK
jgi:hypothetical protein